MHALRKFLDGVLDIVLPLRPRTARTKGRTLEDIPLLPASHDLLKAKITTVLDYRNRATEDLIRSLKYDNSAHAARLAADALADFLREEISSQKNFSPRRILILNVPLHPARIRERGYDQMGIVLERLPQEFRDGSLASVSPGALVRVRATRPQTRLQRSERLSNVAGAFAVPNAALVEGTHVYLIDDVTTTGATLVNAATPLRHAGATVSLIALARA